MPTGLTFFLLSCPGIAGNELSWPSPHPYVAPPWGPEPLGGALPLGCIPSRRAGLEPSPTFWWLSGTTRGCEPCTLLPAIHPQLLTSQRGLVQRLGAPRSKPGNCGPAERALNTISRTLFSLIQHNLGVRVKRWHNRDKMLALLKYFLAEMSVLTKSAFVADYIVVPMSLVSWEWLTRAESIRLLESWSSEMAGLAANKMASALPDRAACVAVL